MDLGQEGLNILEEFEGHRLVVYRDDKGLPTVGWGHLVKPEDHLFLGERISPDQAQAFLLSDTKVACRAVSIATSGVNLTQNEFDALVCLAYNIGSGAFARSTLVRKLKAGDWDGAADQFLVWDKEDGDVSPGLHRRRQAEQDLFTKGW